MLRSVLYKHATIYSTHTYESVRPQTHKQIILDVYTEQLEHRSDKAYVILI